MLRLYLSGDPNATYLIAVQIFLTRDQPVYIVGWVMWVKCGSGSWLDQILPQ